jgi:hypothetical protein
MGKRGGVVVYTNQTRQMGKTADFSSNMVRKYNFVPEKKFKI